MPVVVVMSAVVSMVVVMPVVVVMSANPGHNHNVWSARNRRLSIHHLRRRGVLRSRCVLLRRCVRNRGLGVSNLRLRSVGDGRLGVANRLSVDDGGRGRDSAGNSSGDGGPGDKASDEANASAVVMAAVVPMMMMMVSVHFLRNCFVLVFTFHERSLSILSPRTFGKTICRVQKGCPDPKQVLNAKFR